MAEAQELTKKTVLEQFEANDLAYGKTKDDERGDAPANAHVLNDLFKGFFIH